MIIEEVLRYRKALKRIGTRKLLDQMQGFLINHYFKIGRDAMFDLLADRGLLVTKRKRRGPVTTLSKHRFKKYPNIVWVFHLSKDLSARGPLAALKMALSSNPLRDGLIHHSDRGVQYCCDEYVKLLEHHEVRISMTEKGDPLENALAERVNGILKQELLEEVFCDFETAQREVAIACSTYNHIRPHGSIDNLFPSGVSRLGDSAQSERGNV